MEPGGTGPAWPFGPPTVSLRVPEGPGVGPLPEEAPWTPEEERAGGGQAPEEETPEEKAPPPPEFYLSQARSLLTELRPSGFGELLVTDVWVADPGPERRGAVAARRPSAPTAEGEARQQAWARRHELRQLGLLRERPPLSYDARTEEYWAQVADAERSATGAIMDPYTDFVSAFAGGDIARIPDYRAEVKEYGREADACLGLGRAYMVIGRAKSAQAAFRAAAKADPYRPDIWWHLGLSLLLTRGNDEAAKALARAAEQSPGDVRVQMGLGVARYHLRDFTGAEAELRRVAGSSGVRAAARSLLACSLRLQEKWEEARAELGLLRNSGHPHWMAEAEQCLDCVQRGEERQTGQVRSRRRLASILASLAAAAGGGIWVLYSLAEDYFREQPKLAAGPLLVLLLVLGRALKGISGKESAGEFGNAQLGLPCWQATSWTRPRRADL